MNLRAILVVDNVAGARVAIQGYGAVGKHAARFFADRGALVVAAADSTGTICRRDGLDVSELTAFKDAGGHIRVYEGGEKRKRQEAFAAINEKIRRNTATVLERAAAGNTLPRQAAVAMAEERIRSAMEWRRWS